ncbi:MAG: hypothetical protein FWG71_00615 [Synergistaceae bacterium]|nr:hypothetical protein [Synergistaceae bacterium]
MAKPIYNGEEELRQVREKYGNLQEDAEKDKLIEEQRLAHHTFPPDGAFLKYLLIYCIGVFLSHAAGTGINVTSYTDFLIYRKDLIVRLPYYMMPFIALAWLSWSRYSRSALFFSAGMGLIGIFNHAYIAFLPLRFGLLFFLRLGGGKLSINTYALITLALAVIFAGISLCIFRHAKRLLTAKNDENKPCIF